MDWPSGHLAQSGKKHDQAKPLKGFGGASVLEVVEDHMGDTYRAVYTVKIAERVYVLHCFQKKSTKGIETPKQDMDLIRWKPELEDDKNINLSKEEKEWLKQNPTIKYAGNPNYMPFESFDENGNYVGIVANHLNLIEQDLGIKFEKIKNL